MEDQQQYPSAALLQLQALIPDNQRDSFYNQINKKTRSRHQSSSHILAFSQTEDHNTHQRCSNIVNQLEEELLIVAKKSLIKQSHHAHSKTGIVNGSHMWKQHAMTHSSGFYDNAKQKGSSLQHLDLSGKNNINLQTLSVSSQNNYSNQAERKLNKFSQMAHGGDFPRQSDSTSTGDPNNKKDHDSLKRISSSLIRAKEMTKQDYMHVRPTNQESKMTQQQIQLQFGSTFYSNKVGEYSTSPSHNQNMSQVLNQKHQPTIISQQHKSIGGGMYYFVMNHKRKATKNNQEPGKSRMHPLQSTSVEQQLYNQDYQLQFNTEQQDTGAKRLLHHAIPNMRENQTFQNHSNSEGLEYTIHQLESMASLLKQLEKTVGGTPMSNQKNSQKAPLNKQSGALVFGANRENKTWLPMRPSDIIYPQNTQQKSSKNSEIGSSNQGSPEKIRLESKFPRLSHAISKERLGTANNQVQRKPKNRDKSRRRNITLPKVPTNESKPFEETPRDEDSLQKYNQRIMGDDEISATFPDFEKEFREEYQNFVTIKDYETGKTNEESESARYTKMQADKKTRNFKIAHDILEETSNSSIVPRNAKPQIYASDLVSLSKYPSRSIQPQSFNFTTLKKPEIANKMVSPIFKNVPPLPLNQHKAYFKPYTNSQQQLHSLKASLIESQKSNHQQQINHHSTSRMDNREVTVVVVPVQIINITSINNSESNVNTIQNTFRNYCEKTPDRKLECNFEKVQSSEDYANNLYKQLKIETSQQNNNINGIMTSSQSFTITTTASCIKTNGGCTPQASKNQQEINDELLYKMSQKNQELYQKGVLNSRDRSKQKRHTAALNKQGQMSGSPNEIRNNSSKNFTKILQKMIARQKIEDQSQLNQRPEVYQNPPTPNHINVEKTQKQQSAKLLEPEKDKSFSTPPKLIRDKSTTTPFSHSHSKQDINIDEQQPDPFNFIKKQIPPGKSEFSRAIALSKNNSKNDSHSDFVEVVKASQINKMLNESLERAPVPLYYNFGLQKPVIGPFLNNKSVEQQQLHPSPPQSQHNPGTHIMMQPIILKPKQIQIGNSSTQSETLFGIGSLIQGQTIQGKVKPPLVNKVMKPKNKVSSSVNNQTFNTLENESPQKKRVLKLPQNVLKPITKEIELSDAPEQPLEEPSPQKSASKLNLLESNKSPTKISPAKYHRSSQKAIAPLKNSIIKPSESTKKVPTTTLPSPHDSENKALGERIRPALFVMLEKQLSEAKEPVVKKMDEVIPTAIIEEKVLQIAIWHKEDHAVIKSLAETRVGRALELTNNLLRLANKSQLPPQALYNIPCHQFFSNKDLKCLRKAKIIVPKTKELSSFVRSREFYAQAREYAFLILTAELQMSNHMPGTKLTHELGAGGIPGGYCKFYVGYGNNYGLVKQIMKNRWWYTPSECPNFEESNVVWTSWRKQKITNKLQAIDDYNQAIAEHFTKHRTHIKRLYSRMEDNFHLANKKGLLLNLKEYYRLQGKCVFDEKVFPPTFLIKSNTKHGGPDEHDQLKAHIKKYPNTIWIVKPGENSNRGAGIMLCENSEELEILIRQSQNGHSRTLIQHNCEADSSRSQNQDQKQANMRTMIVQSYIRNPLLIHKRKFDIRVYGMLVTQYGNMRGYFYEDGYLRTSCKEFTLQNFSNKFIHLTNDAIQKNSDDYGKFENSNKLSYPEFQKYLESPDFLTGSKYAVPGGIKFMKDILPQIRHLVAQSFRSVVYKRIDPSRRINSFEIFGFDFMIDDDFIVYLIEANTNPCLEVNGCPVLARIIPNMLECAFRIALDPAMPPPEWNFKKGLEPIGENKFSLIYDDCVEYETIKQLYEGDLTSQARLNNNLNDLKEEGRLEDDEHEQDEEDDEGQ